MFGLLFALLIAAAVFAMLSRRRREQPTDDEPWRASLREEDDGPLDVEEARRAEEEWNASGGESWDADDDDGWRG